MPEGDRGKPVDADVHMRGRFGGPGHVEWATARRARADEDRVVALGEQLAHRVHLVVAELDAAKEAGLAVEQMADLMGNETTSNTGENYRQYYGKSYEEYWDKNVAPPPGGTP